MNRILFATALIFSSLAAAETAGGLTWKAPAAWKVDPPRQMRVATYKVPAAKGDTDEAECAIFYFGQGQGGSVEDNLKRWYGQFTQPDGKSSEAAAKTKKEKLAGVDVTTVDLSGTFASGGMMGPSTPKPGYRLLGAIAEGPEGAVFFKLTGPTKTVEAARPAFQKMLASFTKGAPKAP